MNKIREEDIPEKETPLTPIQAWFFNSDFNVPDYFHQSVEFKVREELNPEIMKKIVLRIIDRHRILRYTYIPESDGIRQYEGDAVIDLEIPFHDISSLPESIRKEELKNISKKTRESIRISRSPMMRMELVKMEEHETYVIWAIHHLIVDFMSWMVLLEELTACYMEIMTEKDILTPPDPLTFRDWSLALRRFYTNDEGLAILRNEMNYWSPLIRDHSYRSFLPLDQPDGNPLLKTVKGVTGKMNINTSRDLFAYAEKYSDTHIEDIVMAAFFRAMAIWGKSSRIVIQLEKAGRNLYMPELEHKDTSRMVGWFTALFPFFMEVHLDEDLNQTIDKIKNIKKNIPQSGFSFSLMRYSDDPEISRIFEGYRDPDVLFDYNDLDHIVEKNPSLDYQAPTASDFSPDEKMPYTLLFTVSKINQKINVTIIYSEEQFQKESIVKLKNLFGFELFHLMDVQNLQLLEDTMTT